LNRQCPATTLRGGQCSGSVPEGKYWCWYHDPANSDKRKRAASRGGKGNRSRVSRDLHKLLEDLTAQVVAGDLEPYPASVAGQLVGVRLRLLEYERRVKEQDELVGRLEELEEQITAEKNSEGRRSSWGV
jgi:hypothetical protein